MNMAQPLLKHPVFSVHIDTCWLIIKVWNHWLLHPFHELDDELWLCWETKADFKCALKQFSVVDLKIIKQKSLCRWSRVLNYETNYKPFVLTPSCIRIIIPLSCSLLSCPSQTDSLFMDPFFFVRECKHHELIPNIDFTELMRSQYQIAKCIFWWKFQDHSCSSNLFNWTFVPLELKKICF